MADLNLKAGTNITLEQEDDDLYINSTTVEPDLSNYYTKSETYSKIEVDDIVGDIDSVLDQINGEVVNNKLTYLNTTKQKIKDGINALGGELTNESTFRSYVNVLNDLYEELPKVTNEEPISLEEE